ncbi:hypothetical protein CRG98_047635 [Punica granatum]|uniref:Uncharacterized protein n=1 Tax=Punica granatum TaxID=22663 RepID=A0A2I0HJU6_PUNGR|nr:hypothetical protein CRG98_047635 [Punica granatum]
MNKPFNIDACVSTEIERHLGTNRAFPTVKTHHRQHATISPEAGHIRLQECLSPKRHPPRERQLTIGSGDHTRHPTQTAKIRASLSNIHSEATLVTHTRGDKREARLKIPRRAVVEKGELISFRLRGTASRRVTVAKGKDPQGKWPSHLLQHDPRSALLPNSTVQGGFFLKHSGRPSTQSKQFKTANTNRRTEEKGDHRYYKPQELRRTLISDSSGYVGALPQSSSPSSHDQGIPSKLQSLLRQSRHLAKYRRSNFIAAATPIYSRSTLCAPEFNLVGARMHEAYATPLGSIHLPVGMRD